MHWIAKENIIHNTVFSKDSFYIELDRGNAKISPRESVQDALKII